MALSRALLVIAGLGRVKQFIRTIDPALTRWERLVRRPAVLFEVRNGFGLDAQAPVIRQLMDRARVRVQVTGTVWSEAELAVQLSSRGVSPALAVSRIQASRRRYALAIVTDTPTIWNWREHPMAYLHHGSSFANLPDLYAMTFLADDTVKYLFCLAQAEVQYCVERLGESVRRRLVVTGQPKIDSLVLGRFDRTVYLEQQGLDPARKTVLLTSHWTPQSLFRSAPLDRLRDYLASLDVNVIVTAHARLFDGTSTLYDGVECLAGLLQLFAGPRMRVVANLPDNRPLLAAADIMIGDHSSVHLEYATLYRPLVLHRHPDLTFCDATMWQRVERTASVVGSVEEIPASVEQALAAPAVDRAARDQLLHYALGWLGQSGQRAATVIEALALTGSLATLVDEATG